MHYVIFIILALWLIYWVFVGIYRFITTTIIPFLLYVGELLTKGIIFAIAIMIFIAVVTFLYYYWKNKIIPALIIQRTKWKIKLIDIMLKRVNDYSIIVDVGNEKERERQLKKQAKKIRQLVKKKEDASKKEIDDLKEYILSQND